MKPQSSLSSVVIIWVMLFGVLCSGFIASPLLGEEAGEGKNKAEQKTNATKEQALQKEIALLVKQLGDDEYQKREAATQGLLKIGKPAIDAVKRAMLNEDQEVVMRAEIIYTHYCKTSQTWAKLELVRTEFYLGEPMSVHFVLENLGDKSITISDDSKGWKRYYRPSFAVQITDAQGKVLDDPISGTHAISSGISKGVRLKPGEQWTRTLMLGQYCLFQKPGEYQVSIIYDKQVNDKTLSPATATITVKKPTDKQARELLKKMLTMSELSGERYKGKLDEPMASFGLLRHPVYLPGLKELVKTHPVEAIRGIGSIGTLDASLVLLEVLATEKRSSVITEGLSQLQFRLPGKNILYDDPSTLYTNLKQAWNKKVSGRAREVFPNLIEAATLEQVERIGSAYARVGKPADMVHLMALMDRAFDELKKQVSNEKAYAHVDSLIDPMEQMIKQGGQWPDEPKTPGEMAAMMVGMSANSKNRPKGWSKYYHQALTGKNVGLQIIAIKTFPKDSPDALQLDLLKVFDVQRPTPVLSRACEQARILYDSRFSWALLNVMSTSKDADLIKTAHRAALACGATPDILADIYVEKIDAENCTDVIKELCDLVTSHDWSGRSISWDDDVKPKALKKRWRVFIDQHRERLKKEQFFKIGDKELTSDLLPRGVKFSKGDKSWSNRD